VARTKDGGNDEGRGRRSGVRIASQREGWEWVTTSLVPLAGESQRVAHADTLAIHTNILLTQIYNIDREWLSAYRLIHSRQIFKVRF
jgi:hypothetical protein